MVKRNKQFLFSEMCLIPILNTGYVQFSRYITHILVQGYRHAIPFYGIWYRNSRRFPFQQISIAIQRINAASVLGRYPASHINRISCWLLAGRLVLSDYVFYLISPLFPTHILHPLYIYTSLSLRTRDLRPTPLPTRSAESVFLQPEMRFPDRYNGFPRITSCEL